MRNMRKITIVVALLALMIGIMPVAVAQDGIESVCLVTDLGRVNDGTFNQFAHDGASAAADDFDLEYSFIETQTEIDYRANIDTCVNEGFEVVVTVGFLIGDATNAAAVENPDVYFIGVDQFVFEGPPNYVGIQFREDQAGFMVGVMAAMVSESGIVAGVYGREDVPPVVRFRNGYEQGVAYVNEMMGTNVETIGVYIDDFLAPDRGASAAEQFIGEGADVIFGAGGPTGTGGIQAAAAQGVWVIGVDQDEYYSSFGEGETEGAEFIITSAVKRVDVGVYDMIAALVEGDMDAFPGGGIYILSVENGGITFACRHDAAVGVPCDDEGQPDLSGDDELTVTMAAVYEGLASGELSTGVDPGSGELLEEPMATEEADG